VTEPVRAAGGLVWRRPEGHEHDDEGAGAVEVVLVHRPTYDDWSFPKGKCHPDESDEAAALREVEEETGLRCRLGPELPSSSYRDGKGRPKVVRYWAMEVESQTPRSPDREVDRWAWVADDRAAMVLTYERDGTVLASLRQVID